MINQHFQRMRENFQSFVLRYSTELPQTFCTTFTTQKDYISSEKEMNTTQTQLPLSRFFFSHCKEFKFYHVDFWTTSKTGKHNDCFFKIGFLFLSLAFFSNVTQPYQHPLQWPQTKTICLKEFQLKSKAVSLFPWPFCVRHNHGIQCYRKKITRWRRRKLNVFNKSLSQQALCTELPELAQ